MMKSFRFGDMLYAENPYVGDNGYCLHVVSRVDNGDTMSLMALANTLNPGQNIPTVNQDEVFAVEGVSLKCVTVEGFALGFDKV